MRVVVGSTLLSIGAVVGVIASAVGSANQHESSGGAEAITVVAGLTIVFFAIPAVVLGTLLLLWGLAARAKS